MKFVLNYLLEDSSYLSRKFSAESTSLTQLQFHIFSYRNN